MLPTNLPAPGAPRDGARVLTPGARRALNLLGIFAAATTLVVALVPRNTVGDMASAPAVGQRMLKEAETRASLAAARADELAAQAALAGHAAQAHVMEDRCERAARARLRARAPR